MGAKSTVWRARVLERRLPPTLIPCRRAVVLYTPDRPLNHHRALNDLFHIVACLMLVFSTLPDDVLTRTFKYLDIRDILALRKVRFQVAPLECYH